MYDLDINKYIKNGFYVPFLQVVLWYFTQDVVLSHFIAMKIFSINYFFWFEHCYDYLPHPYNFLKQFIRFTDSGYIAFAIYYFYPDFYPIAHNVHFVITIGYWFAKIGLNMEDSDSIEHPDIIKWFETGWTNVNHILPYLLLVSEIRKIDLCNNYFTWSDLYYSYIWGIIWFCCIYIPWRTITGDCVYSCLLYTSPSPRDRQKSRMPSSA